MNITLERSNNSELKILAEIYKTEFSKPPYNESWTTKKALDKMKFFKKFYDLYTIRLDKDIIGFICINPKFMCPGEVAFGEEFAIREDLQNKGIGTFILKEIFKIYGKKGFKKFMGIAAIEGRPINLYKRLEILPSKKEVLIERNLK